MGSGGVAHMPRKSLKSESDRNLVKGALKENTLLGALNTFELDEMIDFFEAVTLKAGQKCDVNGNLCVVLEGSVEFTTASEPSLNGSPRCERFASGGVFGQHGLFQTARASRRTVATRSLKGRRVCASFRAARIGKEWSSAGRRKSRPT